MTRALVLLAAAILLFAAFLVAHVAAIWVTACCEVRSLMPMSTTPSPAIWTSPPSMVALPQLRSGSPHQTVDPAKSGWNS